MWYTVYICHLEYIFAGSQISYFLFILFSTLLFFCLPLSASPVPTIMNESLYCIPPCHVISGAQYCNNSAWTGCLEFLNSILFLITLHNIINLRGKPYWKFVCHGFNLWTSEKNLACQWSKKTTENVNCSCLTRVTGLRKLLFDKLCKNGIRWEGIMLVNLSHYYPWLVPLMRIWLMEFILWHTQEVWRNP